MASHQAYNGIYINRDFNQIIVGSDLTKTTTLHFDTPTANRVYTVSDTGTDASFVMTNSQYGQTISGNLYLSGTLSGGTITNSVISSSNGIIDGTVTGYLSGNVINLNTISNGTFSQNYILNSTLSSNVTNEGTFSGGSISSTFVGNNILYGTVSGGTLTNTTLLGNNNLFGTISDCSLSGNITNLNTITGGTYTSTTLTGVTLSGQITNEGTITGYIQNVTIFDTNTLSGTLTGGTLSNVNLLTIGNVTSPLAPIHIYSSGYDDNTGYGHVLIDCANTGSAGGILTLRNSAGGTGAFSCLAFEVEGNTAVNTGTQTTVSGLDASSAMIYCENKGSSGATLGVRVNTGSTNVDMITITPDQRVGINTTSPLTTLDVNGSIRATGGTISDIYLSGNCTNLGTLSGGSLSGVIYNLHTITGGTLSKNVFLNTTLSGTIYNTGTIEGGTISNAIISGGSILTNVNIIGGTSGSGSVQNSTLTNNSLTGINYNYGTLSGGTLSSVNITSGTISSNVIVLASTSVSGNLNQSTITTSTLSGTNYNLGTLSGGTISGVYIDSITGGTVANEFTNLESILSNTSYYYVCTSSYTIPSLLYGSLNVYTDIQSAITACHTAGGGIVVLMTGTFAVTSALTIYSNVTLQGQGTGASIIDCSGMSNNTYLLSGSNVSNVNIRDLTIYNSSTSNVIHPFYFSNSCSYIILQNIVIDYTPLTGTTAQPYIYFSGDNSNTPYYSCNIQNCRMDSINISYSGIFKRCYLTENVIWENSSSTASTGYQLSITTPSLSASNVSEIYFINNYFFATSSSGQHFMQITNNISSPTYIYSGIDITFQQNIFRAITSSYMMVWTSNRGTNVDTNSVFTFTNNQFNFQYLFYDLAGDGSTAWMHGCDYNIYNNYYTGSGNPGLFSNLPTQGGNATTVNLNIYNNSPAFSLDTAYYSANGAMTVNSSYANGSGLFVKSPSNQIVVTPMNTVSANVNDTNLYSVNLHFNAPSANRYYTISDVGTNANFVMSNSTNAQTLSGLYVLSGTLSGGSLSGTIYNMNTISGGTLTQNTLTNSTLSGITLNEGIISGGTLSSITLTGNNYLYGTITGGTLSDNIYNVGTITGGTYTNAILFNSTLSSLVYNSSTISGGYLSNVNISGNNVLLGTLSDGSLSGNVVNLNTITGGTLSANLIVGATLNDQNNLLGTLSGGSLSGNIYNLNTITGGTFSNILLQGNIQNIGTISGGSIYQTTFTGNNVLSGTISEGTLSTSTLLNTTLSGNTILNGTISGGTYTGIIQNPTTNAGISYINGGNVGIGTTSPSSTLHVAGTFQATSATLTTAVITGNPNTTQSGYTGNYALFQLSSTTNSYATGISTLIWDDVNTYFSSNITHSNGVFTFANTGVYNVMVELLPSSNYANSIVSISMQNSADGITFSSDIYIHTGQGAYYGATWLTTRSLKAYFMINVTSSTSYWRVMINSNSASNIAFTTGQASRIIINDMGSVTYCQTNVNMTSLAVASNTALVLGSPAEFTSNDISISSNTITFTKNANYVMHVQISASAANGTSRLVTVTLQASSDSGATFNTIQTGVTTSAFYANGQINTVFIINTSVFTVYKLLYSNVTSALSTYNTVARSRVMIYGNTYNIYTFGRNCVLTYATTPLSFVIESKGNSNAIMIDDTSGHFFIKNLGIYTLDMIINSDTTVTQQLTFSLQNSSDGITWSNNIYTSTEYNTYTTAYDILPVRFIFQVTSTTQFWRIMFSKTSSMNINNTFEYSKFLLQAVSSPSLTQPTGGLIRTYYNSGEVVQVIYVDQLQQYLLKTPNSISSGIAMTVTSSGTYGTTYQSTLKMFQYTFSLKQNISDSYFVVEMDGSFIFNTTNATATITIAVEVKNANFTNVKFKQQNFVAVAGGGTRGNTLFPLSMIFSNTSGQSNTNTLSVYIFTSAANSIIFDEWHAKAWNMVITEIKT